MGEQAEASTLELLMESRDGSPEQARAAQSQQSEHYEKAQAAVEATWVQPAQVRGE